MECCSFLALHRSNTRIPPSYGQGPGCLSVSAGTMRGKCPPYDTPLHLRLLVSVYPPRATNFIHHTVIHAAGAGMAAPGHRALKRVFVERTCWQSHRASTSHYSTWSLVIGRSSLVDVRWSPLSFRGAARNLSRVGKMLRVRPQHDNNSRLPLVVVGRWSVVSRRWFVPTAYGLRTPDATTMIWVGQKAVE